jgi:hypothetical protein
MHVSSSLRIVLSDCRIRLHNASSTKKTFRDHDTRFASLIDNAILPPAFANMGCGMQVAFRLASVKRAHASDAHALTAPALL